MLDKPSHFVLAHGAPIALRDVSFRYPGPGGGAVLTDTSLSVEAGEFVCLLGGSGCGKTTLLNLVAGFMAPDNGSIETDGAIVTGPSPQRGVVFQEYSLFPWLTAQGNIEFGLRMAGMVRRERQSAARELLDLVGLSQAANCYPFQLSGGMKQRVAIARALACSPRILLMDEPFAALDALTRGRLQEEIVAIHERHRMTVLFVTHNIAEAVGIGTRALVMGGGGSILAEVSLEDGRPRRRSSPEYDRAYGLLADALNVERSE